MNKGIIPQNNKSYDYVFLNNYTIKQLCKKYVYSYNRSSFSNDIVDYQIKDLCAEDRFLEKLCFGNIDIEIQDCKLDKLIDIIMSSKINKTDISHSYIRKTLKNSELSFYRERKRIYKKLTKYNARYKNGEWVTNIEFNQKIDNSKKIIIEGFDDDTNTILTLLLEFMQNSPKVEDRKILKRTKKTWLSNGAIKYVAEKLNVSRRTIERKINTFKRNFTLESANSIIFSRIVNY